MYAVKAYQSKMDKVMRLHSVSNTIENGFCYVPEKAAWLPEYLHELSTFPKGKHDDQVDSTSQALDWFKELNSIDNWWIVAAPREHKERMQREGPPRETSFPVNRVPDYLRPKKSFTEECPGCKNKNLERFGDQLKCLHCNWRGREGWIIPAMARM